MLWTKFKHAVIIVFFYLAFCSKRNFVSPATLPALSGSRTVKRARRPSAAKPLSKQRPRTVVSMFPPHSTTTTLLRNEVVLRGHLKIIIKDAQIQPRPRWGGVLAEADDWLRGQLTNLPHDQVCMQGREQEGRSTMLSPSYALHTAIAVLGDINCM